MFTTQMSIIMNLALLRTIIRCISNLYGADLDLAMCWGQALMN